MMPEELSKLLEMSRIAREFCHRFLYSCISESKGRMVNELFWVPSVLIARILRSQEAIELLLKEGFLAEAAIVALSQFELRLDILYIGVNVHRATQWVEHESKKRQPWNVADKINKVYCSDTKRKNAQNKTFEMLSAVKHGNPVAGGFGFSMRTEGKKISVTTGEIDDSLTLSYKLVVCGFCIHQLLEALEGVSRAFSKFIKIDVDLYEKLVQLLQESKRKMVQTMRRVSSDF